MGPPVVPQPSPLRVTKVAEAAVKAPSALLYTSTAVSSLVRPHVEKVTVPAPGATQRKQ